MGINSFSSLVKFIFKPSSVLLEDQGSETSSKEHDQIVFVFVIQVSLYKENNLTSLLNFQWWKLDDLECFETMFDDIKRNKGVLPIQTIEKVGSLYCPMFLKHV